MLGLDPGEPPGHPIEDLVGLGLPTSKLYSVAHGHRLISDVNTTEDDPRWSP